MENIFKETLIEQMRAHNISIRELHLKIEEICTMYSEYTWFSLSTLERKIKEPSSLDDEEAELVRLALKDILTNVDWIHLKRTFQYKKIEKYKSQLESVLNNGISIHERVEPLNEYELQEKQPQNEYEYEIEQFYNDTPFELKSFWNKHLNTYLSLPDLTKASLMCSVYIGKDDDKNNTDNAKIKKFLNYFPLFDSCNQMLNCTDKEIKELGKILSLLSELPDTSKFNNYRKYAYNREAWDFSKAASIQAISQNKFIWQANQYKNAVSDFEVHAKDFIHAASFMVFLDKTDWILAYATTIFAYKMRHDDSYQYKETEFHDTGCTGFKFTDEELGYLCELIRFMEEKK